MWIQPEFLEGSHFEEKLKIQNLTVAREPRETKCAVYKNYEILCTRAELSLPTNYMGDYVDTHGHSTVLIPDSGS